MNFWIKEENYPNMIRNIELPLIPFRRIDKYNVEVTAHKDNLIDQSERENVSPLKPLLMFLSHEDLQV